MNKILDFEKRKGIKLFRNQVNSNPNFTYIKDAIESPECGLSYKNYNNEIKYLECLVIAKDVNGDWYAVDKEYRYWRFFKSDIISANP